MRQHISIKQLNELSEKGKERLRKWWKPKIGDWQAYRNITSLIEEPEFERDYEEYVLHIMANKDILPLLSIGQMVEFLDEYQEKVGTDLEYIDESDYDRVVGTILRRYKNKNACDIGWKGELCDALWEAVKEVLEK